MLEIICKITDGATYDPSIYGHFVLVEVGDSIAEVEAKTGCRVLNGRPFSDFAFQPSFEWLVEHHSFYEAVFIFSDDGFGVNLLIPKALGIDADLLAMCAKYAVPA